jgi:serine protease Do
MSRHRFAFSLGGKGRGLVLASALAGIVGALIGQETPSAPPPPASIAEQIGSEVRGLMERSASAICRVEGADAHSSLRGTGFFVDADGTLLTTYSVGGQTEDLVVTFGEQRFPASRKLAHERSGLAVLKIETREPVPFLRPGKSTDLTVASPVVALGFPMELALSPSFGLVAGFDLKFQGKYFAARHLRANLVVQGGQAGSPVLNLKGDVVGVLISTVDNGSGVFALPIEAANKLLRDLQRYGRVRQGWLGADVRVTDATEFGSSARIRALRLDGPGYKGGLRPGDVLLRIGDRKITNPEDVVDASFYVTADEPLKVQVARVGKEQELTVMPGDAPDGETPGARFENPAILTDRGMGLDSPAGK